MNYFKVAVGVIIALSASRFIPHPPNFTSLIALSFYVPAIFGIRFIPAVIIAMLFTDLIIGFHSTLLFTWGSVLLIGLLSKYINTTMSKRIFGSLLGAFLFYIITNFGVWIGGGYGYSANGLMQCYILALPFFGYTFISTLIFSAVIETILKISKYKKERLFKI